MLFMRENVTEDQTKSEWKPNIHPKKQWQIKEPVQNKSGSWYSCILDPSYHNIVFECYDVTKNMTFQTCIQWCHLNNKYADEIEQENKLKEQQNANTTPVGPTLAENSPSNCTTEQGSVHQGGSSSSNAGQ